MEDDSDATQIWLGLFCPFSGSQLPTSLSKEVGIPSC